MVVVVFCVISMLAAPSGYLTGEVFAHTYGRDTEDDGINLFAILGALFVPAAAIMALMVLLKEGMK